MSRTRTRHQARTPLPDYTPVEITIDTSDEPVIAHIVRDKIADAGVFIVRFSATSIKRGIYPDRVNATTDTSAWMEAAYLALLDGRNEAADALYVTALELRAGRNPTAPRPGPFLVVS